MSVREYIGARYVPLFAEPLQWDATRTYEPLTVVLHQGNSYTSRQAVPANIDIANTTYWAQTGNYNAQIEQYRAEVQAFDNRITANADAISDEETARANADAAINDKIGTGFDSTNTVADAISDEETARANADTSLGGRIDTEATTRANADESLSSAIATINGQIRLSNYKAIIYGDSTMVEANWDTTPLGTLIAQETGMTISNRAVGGTGISNFLTLLNTAGSSDFSGYDFVFMAYCTNDWQSGTTIWDTMTESTENTFHDKLVACFDRLDAIRGTCRPIFVTPAYGVNPNLNVYDNMATNTNRVGASLENYIDVVAEECHKRGYGMIDLYHTMGVSMNNYQTLLTRSAYDSSSSDYNVYVHYSQMLKQRIARAFLEYFPYMVPAVEKNDTCNKLIMNLNNQIVLSASHNEYRSRVPIVCSFKKPQSQNLVFAKQILTGRNTISFYAIAFAGYVQLTTSTDVIRWNVSASGYYDLYVDGVFGPCAIYFIPQSTGTVKVGNLMITEGHNSFASYSVPTGATGMKRSPSGWSNKGDATHVWSGISGQFYNIFMNNFALTEACNYNENLMVLANMAVTESNMCFVADIYDPTNGWKAEMLTIIASTNNIYLRPQRNLPVGTTIHALVAIPIVQPFLSNESWS